VKPAVNVITLGVRDLARSKRFYTDGLGWPTRVEDDNWIVFPLGGGATELALYPWDDLADDAGVPADGSGFRGVSLAYVVRAEERVDAVLSDAERAGAKIVKLAQRTDWGGYSGYFADPDGHLWEVVQANELPAAE
jgi:catechol 2,3-dioxygenase-like lactoylglutathione lyase family enzyme